MAENYFKQLYDIDVNDKKKQKNGLSYLSWAACWAEVKKLFPDATFKIYEHVIEIEETKENITIKRKIERPWYDDGITGWVKTGVIINEIEHIEELPIMDFKNKSIPATNITSADANKSIQRSLTKACARHGLGLYIYEGDEFSEETREQNKLHTEIMDLIKKKAALSDEAKAKVEAVCKDADANANGDPRLIEDVEVLKILKKSLMAIRK